MHRAILSCYPERVNPFQKYTIRTLGFLLALSTAPAWASSGDHSVGLLVGQVWPGGKMADGIDGGNVAPGLTYEYAASDVFSVYAQGVHSSHGDGSLTVTSTTAGLKAHLVYYDKLAPYVLVGAGLYFVNKDFANPLETAHKTNFGFHLGLGADLDVSESAFAGLQLDLHSLFAGNTTLPSGRRVEISGRWTGFFLRGGIRF